jgi:hypothetical protein
VARTPAVNAISVQLVEYSSSHAGACQYYLPAFLYAMTDPEIQWRYLSPVLDTLWYEDDYEEPLHNDPLHRGVWEEFASILTDPQKKCIAHFLEEVLKSTRIREVENPEQLDEVIQEADRIEHMLKKYWNAWL